MAPAGGAEAAGPGQADGVPRDHPGAIDRAVENWRDIDYGLVDAQEARRIVDRLYGYPVSGVLWRKVNGGLSAGRVQSPAVRLVVERERERMAFVAAGYWDLAAEFPTTPAFGATLVGVGGQRVANGAATSTIATAKSGDSAPPRVLDEGDAERPRRPGRRDLHRHLGRREAVPKLTEAAVHDLDPPAGGWPEAAALRPQVMRVAQGLYERGYITYMRTDSVTLSDTALTAARSQAPRALRTGVRAGRAPHLHPQGEERRRPTRPSARPARPSARRRRSPVSCGATSGRSTTSSGSAPSPRR